jgi:hypothetical protein
MGLEDVDAFARPASTETQPARREKCLFPFSGTTIAHGRRMPRRTAQEKS